MSFNLIVFRHPTKICMSDSFPHGMGGGGSVLSGNSWGVKLPIELVGKVSNNLLEHMAEIIYMWIVMLSGVIIKLDCFLSFGVNTSAVSWLHLTRFFMKGYEAHEETSNKIAQFCMEHHTCLCEKHFKNKCN